MVRKVLYWVAVLVVSLAVVLAVILFFESRDRGSLGRSSIDARHPTVAAEIRPHVVR